MVKLNKIYTKSGDNGTTALGGFKPQRVAKHSLRVVAYGTVDEAGAAIGLARLHTAKLAMEDGILERVQNDLFDLGADLSTPHPEAALKGEASTEPPASKNLPETPPAEKDTALRIVATQVERLEGEIDQINGELSPLNSFILSGGSPASAYLHFARTVTRRAERLAYELASTEKVNPVALRYLNRLSDLLFVLARRLNENGAKDVLWKPAQTRTVE